MYFDRMDHFKSTRNNGFSVDCLQFAFNLGKKFYYQGAKLFNELPIGLRSLTSRILFNPLSPNIHTQILQTDLHTFP